MEIVNESIDGMYQLAFQHVLLNGAVEESRAGKTVEVLGMHFCLTNPRNRVIFNPARKISLRFMLAEFLWIMSGRSDVEMVSFYNKKMKDFSDDGITLHGAYGRRLRQWQDFDQLDAVIKKLEESPNTRQAVAIIFDPKKDYGETKDVPCNNLLQFIVRKDKLNMFVYVRSQDLFLGLPYDMFHWTLLQELIANSLGVDVGSYYHTTGSLHIYESNWEQGRQIANSGFVCGERMPKVDIGFRDLSRLFSIEERLRTDGVLPQVPMTSFESWVVEKMIKK